MQADRKRAVRNDRLRRARIERNLTQAEVAEQVGASELSVSRWELGTQAPLPFYREKLCRLYGKSPAELGLLAEAEPAEPAARVPGGEERARRDLLAQVRRYWIDTELEAATNALPRLAPGLAERPDAVDDPVRVRPRPHATAAGRLLPPEAAIGDVYRGLGQQLLILGAPGAGKTTLLLRLASELLGSGDGPLPEPMPVVFHLASWAAERKPLATWLVDELYRRYGLARRIGQRWVRDDQVMPLLDGLDEVAERHRVACVEAINAFRSDHGQLPIVVCCRTAWYESLAARLALRGAVEILPLTAAQVQLCLAEGGERVAGLRALVAGDEQLLALLTTPVFLTIAALTYRDRPPGEHAETATLAERRRRLLRDYVEARLARQAGGADQPYPRERTLAWLGWLARTMRAHEQSVLYLDWMQPSWLPTAAQRRVVTLGVTAVIALAVGLLVGVNWSANWWSLGAAPAVSIGVTTGLLVATYHAVLAHESRIVPAEELRWSWSALRSLPRWLGAGLAAGIVAGLVFGMVLGIVLAVRPDVLSGPRSAGAPPPAGAITLRDGLVTGVVSGVVNGGILCVLICLTVGLLTGLRARPPVTDMAPGGSVAASGRTAIAGGLVGAGVFGLGFALVYGLGTSWTGPLVHQAAETLRLGGVYWPVAAPNDIAVAVLLGGSVAGLQRGGGAYLRHRVLLWLLALDDHAPRDYPAFLEHAARLILLQRRGGGYEFVHRVLLDELADADGSPTGTRRPADIPA